MEVLSMDSLPLGFRFRPTDEELITHYLKLKINGRHSDVHVIPEVDVCKWEPWDLPGLSVIKSDDPEWFFFCPRDRKYPNGQRSNRATEAGYWKATGKDRTIRSRKPGSGNTNNNNNNTVGMKKTLVFYRGRAPKGERTNWIMHEYRPTLKELDGTGPGQNAFVLCRLFRKPEEKTDTGNYDEVEQTGYSPTATKSSPDETSSDLVQETATPNLPVENQSEGIKRWLTDNADSMIPNSAAPVDSGCNSHITSDIEDHVGEASTASEYPLLEENSHPYEPMPSQLDGDLFAPMQSHGPFEPIFYMDSPYANDFGNDLTGFHCHDGTSEQEVLLTELLDEVFNNHEESSCEESTSQKNSAVGNEAQLSSEFQQGKFQIVHNSTYCDADTEMAQVQASHDSLMRVPLQPAQASLGFGWEQASGFNRELGIGNIGDLGNNHFGQDALSVNFVLDSSFGLFNSMEESTNQINPINNGSNVTGTRIKIRTRQSQVQPHSASFVAQGTAPRRLRLQIDRSTESFGNDRVRDARHTDDDEEVQSVLKELPTESVGNDPAKDTRRGEEDEQSIPQAAGDSEDQTPTTSDEVQKENQLPNFDKSRESTEVASTHLRLRAKRKSGSSQIESSAPAETPPTLRGASPSFIVSICLVLIMFVVFIGMWRWLVL